MLHYFNKYGIMPIVNIKKKVLSLVVCVTAIVLSGCTAADATRTATPRQGNLFRGWPYP